MLVFLWKALLQIIPHFLGSIFLFRLTLFKWLLCSPKPLQGMKQFGGRITSRKATNHRIIVNRGSFVNQWLQGEPKYLPGAAGTVWWNYMRNTGVRLKGSTPLFKLELHCSPWCLAPVPGQSLTRCPRLQLKDFSVRLGLPNEQSCTCSFRMVTGAGLSTALLSLCPEFV